MAVLFDRLSLLLILLASAFALLVVADGARADAGLVLASPADLQQMHIDGANTVLVTWGADSSQVDQGPNNPPKITFTSKTSTDFSRTVLVNWGVSSLLLPPTSTKTTLQNQHGVVSVDPSWTVGPFLPADTYDMTMTVYDPLKPGVPSGTFTVTNIKIIGLCIPSTYSSDGYEPCTEASPGHYVDTPGAKVELPCQPGLFMTFAGAWRCLDSPRGYFVGGSGAKLADPCPAGSYQPDQGQIACLLAPRGYFAAVAGAEHATLCAAGSYQPKKGQVDCDVAPANTYVDSKPPISTATCPAGTTSAKGSSSVADCIEPPACRLAVRAIVSATCIARALNVSLAGARSVVLRPTKSKQSACRIVKGRLKTIAVGTCKVVLVVRPKHGKVVAHRGIVTVTQ